MAPPLGVLPGYYRGSPLGVLPGWYPHPVLLTVYPEPSPSRTTDRVPGPPPLPVLPGYRTAVPLPVLPGYRTAVPPSRTTCSCYRTSRSGCQGRLEVRFCSQWPHGRASPAHAGVLSAASSSSIGRENLISVLVNPCFKATSQWTARWTFPQNDARSVSPSSPRVSSASPCGSRFDHF